MAQLQHEHCLQRLAFSFGLKWPVKTFRSNLQVRSRGGRRRGWGEGVHISGKQAQMSTSSQVRTTVCCTSTPMEVPVEPTRCAASSVTKPVPEPMSRKDWPSSGDRACSARASVCGWPLITPASLTPMGSHAHAALPCSPSSSIKPVSWSWCAFELRSSHSLAALPCSVQHTKLPNHLVESA